MRKRVSIPEDDSEDDEPADDAPSAQRKKRQRKAGEGTWDEDDYGEGEEEAQSADRRPQKDQESGRLFLDGESAEFAPTPGPSSGARILRIRPTASSQSHGAGSAVSSHARETSMELDDSLVGSSIRGPSPSGPASSAVSRSTAPLRQTPSRNPPPSSPGSATPRAIQSGAIQVDDGLSPREVLDLLYVCSGDDVLARDFRIHLAAENESELDKIYRRIWTPEEDWAIYRQNLRQLENRSIVDVKARLAYLEKQEKATIGLARFPFSEGEN